MGIFDKMKKVFSSDEEKIGENKNIGERINNIPTDYGKKLVLDESYDNELDMKKTKIMFVGAGNTCRSAIAEAIFKRKSDIAVCSAGTHAISGNKASQNTIKICKHHNIDLTNFKSTDINDITIEEITLILTAATDQKDTLKEKYPKAEIFTLNEYVGKSTTPDIPDPFACNMSIYEKCFNDIEEAIELLIKKEGIGKKTTSNEKRCNKNFTYFNKLIHNGQKEIQLEKDITLDIFSNEEKKYSKGIIIDVDDIVIDGNGHTIDAQGKTRIFTCIGKNITIKNVTLQNGYTKFKGGAIYNNQGTITLEKTILTQNTAEKGGAIYNVRGTITIENTTLKNNKAEYSGGAINNKHYAANLNVRESKIENNAARDGGAIINDRGTLTITNTTLTENTATRGGGAIINDRGTISIENSRLNNNNAIEKGGAFFNIQDYDEEIKIQNTSFNNNTSKKELAHDIYNNGKLMIIESHFKNNNKNTIYNKKILCLSNKKIEKKIHNKGKIIFIKNIESKQKNFTYLNQLINSGEKVIELKNDILLKEEEKEKYPEGIVINVDDIILKGNGHTIDAQGKTRIFQTSGKNITIENIILQNGCIEKNGGAITNKGNLTIKKATLYNNISYKLGGAINNFGELTIIDSSLNENLAMNNGGAIMNNENGTINIQNIHFDNNCINSSCNDIINQGNLILSGKNSSNQRKTIINERKLFVSDNYEDYIDNSHTIQKIKLLEKHQCDFTFLNELIQKGNKKIKLNKDIILNVLNNEEQRFKDGIKIENELILDGNGHTIDAQHLTRIFQCNGKNIIIKNITLKNGFAKDFGGAIFINNGSLFIKDSTILQNTATENGGAIFNRDKLIISNSILSHNETTSGSGGAIINKGELNITESTFSNNISQANNDGGAIFNDKSILVIKKSTLNNNIAQYCEGDSIYNNYGKTTIIESIFTNAVGTAIYNHYGAMTISKSQLNNNKSAIKSYFGKITISDCKLNYNHSLIYNCSCELTIIKSIFTHNAGAIENNLGDLTIRESKFNNNIMNQNSGIITNKGNSKIFNCELSENQSSNNIILNNDFLNIYNTNFKNNKSEYIMVNDETSNLSIFYNTFSGNTVEKTLIFNKGKKLTIDKNIFDEKISNGTPLIINKSNLILIKSKIKDSKKMILNDGYLRLKKFPSDFENRIYGNGIVEVNNQIQDEELFDFGYLDRKIHENTTKKIILDKDIFFEEYEMDFYEGGIELDIDDLVIDGNGHTIDGAEKSRIFMITGNNITLKNITFKNGHSHKNYDNTLNNNGGAIKINHNLNIKIKNCRFVNNISEDNGGAIYNNNGTLTLSNSILNYNQADESGGAIYNKGKLTIINSKLKDNIAENHGGAIYNNNAELTISNSRLKKNNTTGYDGKGGAINNESDGTITIQGTTLQENTSVRGGAIDNHGTITIQDTTLQNNKAVVGGAIHNWDGRITIQDITLTENTATRDGGAINNEENGTIIIQNTTLQNNTTTGESSKGGAICNSKGKLKILESIINENHSTGYGGAITNEKGTIEVLNTSFNNNNTLKGGGGVIYNSKGIINIQNSIFKRNFAIYGGAISSGGTLIINKSTFTKNIAKDGYDFQVDGGAISNGGKLNIINSRFIKNKSTADGGAISNGGKLNIINSRFMKNKSKANGGAINNGGYLIIKESILTENTVEYKGGGAIYNDWNGKTTITNSRITNKTANGKITIQAYISTEDGVIHTREDNAIEIINCKLEYNSLPKLN